MSRESHSFSAVEQLDEAAQALGWSIEYRQLSRGGFAAKLASVEARGVCLATERFNNHLQIHSTPPDGFVGLFLARFEQGWMRVGRQVLGSGALMVLPSRSELEVVTRGVIRNETLFMQQGEFMRAVQALGRCDSIVSAGDAELRRCDPQGMRRVARMISAAHRSDRPDEETVSGILSTLIGLLVDESSTLAIETVLNGEVSAIARRAQDYIELGFRRAVRMQDLCTHVGVSMRTLQRCFATHFQMSPTAYLKARRLNAARRELRAGSAVETSVTEVAMNNGLMHLGRFAADYRRHFGESPSKTLRN